MDSRFLNPFFIPLTEDEGEKLDDLIVSAEGLTDQPFDNMKAFFWNLLSVLKNGSINETVSVCTLMRFNIEIGMLWTPSNRQEHSVGYFNDIMRYIEDFYEELFGNSLILTLDDRSLNATIQEN